MENDKNMDKELQAFVAEFWKIDLDRVVPELLFDDAHIKGFASIRFYRFIADLEKKFKVNITNLSSIFSFKDLLTNISKK